MPRRSSASLDADLLQGTLDLLVLQTLQAGPAHGLTIAHVIEHRSDALLQVQHGSLYPALHRLEDRGWVASVRGTRGKARAAARRKLGNTGRIREEIYAMNTITLLEWLAQDGRYAARMLRRS